MKKILSKINIFSKNKKGSKQESAAFNVLQKLGKSFMLPIALLPIAGLLLGIGSAFSNYEKIYFDQTQSVLGAYSALGTLLNVMKFAGQSVFENLPLLFAIALPFGMSTKNKAMAALAGLLSYIMINIAINGFLALQGINEYTTGMEYLKAHGYTTQNQVAITNRYIKVLGIFTLRTSVFGGIIAGTAAHLMIKYVSKIKFKNEWVHQFLGNGKIGLLILPFASIFLAPVIFYVWQVMFLILKGISIGVEKTSYFGTFLFGFTERALVPFGVHHTFYMPFWQTALGGTEVVNGASVMGAQNIFFQQMQDPNLEHYSVVHGSRFWAGRNIFDIFGIPAAAFGLWLTLPKGKRGKSGSLLISAALTSMITGITEPFEFTFLFVAPLLYWLPYCILAGLAHVAVHLGNIGIGQVFSGGLIETIIFGVIQGNAKTSWMQLLWIGPIFSVAYFSLFFFWIKFRNVQILGRGNSKVALKSKVEYQKAKKQKKVGINA